MNNQGLEALAALAAAAPATATSTAGSNEVEKTSDPDSCVGESASQQAADIATSTNVAADLPAHLGTQLQGNQQLQHLRNLQQIQAGNGSLSANPELAMLLGGAAQLSQRGADRAGMAALHNMAYQHLLLQSLPQSAQTKPTQTAQPTQGAQAATMSNPAVAAAATHLASLLGLNQNGLPSTNNSLLSASSQRNDVTSLPGNVSAPLAQSSHASLLAAATASTSSAAPSSSMPPPPPSAPTSPPVSAAPQATSRGAAPSIPRNLLAPNPSASVSSQRSSGRDSVPDEDEIDESFHSDDKKEQKRAANRRSAQLSRKRKKQFIEELKEENDDLRRKEQILKSIPDLVVVFDSTGKLWFVSQSISRFIHFSTSELEGKSFWDRLCPESVRLLKAAFMDSLAARESHTDTVPLGTGLWDLRLLDKDGSLVTVTLNGVVHFAGERPECVCCIRPKDDGSSSLSDGQEAEDLAERPRAVMRQAIISDTSTTAAAAAPGVASDKVTGKTKSKGREAIRISDSCNSSGSGESVSGSDE